MITIMLTACGLDMRSDSKAATDNISGTYIYAGLAECQASQFPNPLIDLNNIKKSSEVIIKHNDGKFEVSYLSKKGKPINKILDLNDKDNKNTVMHAFVIALL